MLGSQFSESGNCEFRVWGGNLNSLSVKLMDSQQREIELEKDENGYWQSQLRDVFPGTRYYYRLNDSELKADPASNYQPEGVHGPSEIINHYAFKWSDGEWKNLTHEDMIIYEIHVGTFTPEGTFGAICERLADLVDLGVNTIELMPVAQFPGERNWGYDGVFPFAVQNSYGGPEKLKELVDCCHRHKIAVLLDVVYNHLGPEGNVTIDYGPYFTSKYKTPWGKAVNFDDQYSDQVREYFFSNALYWLKEYHIDGLRLDAVHAIYDMSPKPFLQELAEKVHDFSEHTGKKHFLIGESDLGDVRIIKPRQQGGYGLDGQWCDDFHHSLHTLLTNEKTGYYIDFGKPANLVKAYNEGFVYSWQYSQHRKRHHGSSSRNIPAKQFVVFSQNHDQTGNRMLGERLSSIISYEQLKLAAGCVLFSPFVPLLFMGEEYGETCAFLYFVSHQDRSLVEAVRKGRAEEFKSFQWKGRVPDPQAQETFEESKLDWQKRCLGKHNKLLEFYKELLAMRKEVPALSHLSKENLHAENIFDKKAISLHRWHDKSEIICFMNFERESFDFVPGVPQGRWIKLIDSSDTRWAGVGTKLPEEFSNSQNLSLPGFTFAAYTKSERKQ